MFDPVAEAPDAALASRVVWFDAYVTNIDRTPKNVNLLTWHRNLWLIDHGAALYFHHAGGDWRERAGDRFAAVKQHVLLPYADAIAQADAELASRLPESTLRAIVDLVPEPWLEGGLPREAYVEYLVRRLDGPRGFVEEAIRARSLHV
jgi:hypothetical protein